MSSIPGFAEQAIDGLLQWWKVSLHDLEHPMNVDSEVLVGDQVSKPGDVGPGISGADSRVSGLKCLTASPITTN